MGRRRDQSGDRLGSSLLGFFQEYRASQAVQELKRRLALIVRVVRDGVERSAPFASVVPGDILLLSAGNLIPADGLVLEAADFLVSEASMTGESFPVEKRQGVVRADAPLAARADAVFLGASVRSGTAKVLAVRTGRRTEFGAIAARTRGATARNGVRARRETVRLSLIRVMVLIVLFVLAVNLLLRRPALKSLSFAVALAVGLRRNCCGDHRMTLSAQPRDQQARRDLSRLDAIGDLGGVDVLCTDKTGTLTQGVIVLREALDPAAEARTRFGNSPISTLLSKPASKIRSTPRLSRRRKRWIEHSGLFEGDEIPYDFIRRRLTA